MCRHLMRLLVAWFWCQVRQKGCLQCPKPLLSTACRSNPPLFVINLPQKPSEGVCLVLARRGGVGAYETVVEDQWRKYDHLNGN
ncbi:unnamed protein product [Ceratitis capitata]|uniref:(Mediterranean fruit fly) hypothetical protein n=1 Tax=Ceratitis capitata TaxID=7213 RepID=A0A811VE15_CERCA|nr:unnamed protein product [Ceratitis capitata]